MYSSFLSTPVSVALCWLFERSIDLEMPEMEQEMEPLPAPKRRASAVVMKKKDSMRQMAMYLSQRRQHSASPAPTASSPQGLAETANSKKQSATTFYPLRTKGGGINMKESTDNKLQWGVEDSNRKSLHDFPDPVVMGGDECKDEAVNWNSGQKEAAASETDRKMERYTLKPKTSVGKMVMWAQASFKGMDDQNEKAISEKLKILIDLYETEHEKLGERRHVVTNFFFRKFLGRSGKDDLALLRMRRNALVILELSRRLGELQEGGDLITAEAVLLRVARAETTNPFAKRAAAWFHHAKAEVITPDRPKRRATPNRNRISTNKTTEQRKWAKHDDVHLARELQRLRQVHAENKHNESTPSMFSEATLESELTDLDVFLSSNRFSGPPIHSSIASFFGLDFSKPNDTELFPAIRPGHYEMRPQTCAEVTAMGNNAQDTASCSPSASIGSLLDELEFAKEEVEKNSLTAKQVKRRRIIGWNFFLVYNAVCAFYICLFGISYPDYVESWLVSFYVGICQDTLFCLPAKLALFFYILPMLCPKRLSLKKVKVLPEYSISVQLSREFPQFMASKLILASKRSIHEADYIVDHEHFHNIFHGREETYTYRFLDIPVTLFKASLFLVIFWPLGVQEFLVDNAIPAILVYLIIGVYQVYNMSWWGKLVVYGGTVMIFLVAIYVYYVVLKNELPAVMKPFCFSLKRSNKQTFGGNNKHVK